MADREAFDAYVRARWHPLLRTAVLLTGDFHSAEDLAWVEQELNDRPRKRLDYARPSEVINDLLLR